MSPAGLIDFKIAEEAELLSSRRHETDLELSYPMHISLHVNVYDGAYVCVCILMRSML